MDVISHKIADKALTRILDSGSHNRDLSDLVKRRVLSLLYIQSRARKNHQKNSRWNNPWSYLYSWPSLLEGDYSQSEELIMHSDCHIIAHYVWFWHTDDVGNRKWSFNMSFSNRVKLMTIDEAEQKLGFPCIVRIYENPKEKIQLWELVDEKIIGEPEHSAIILWRDNDGDIIMFEQAGRASNIGIRKLKNQWYGKILLFWAL